jgi:phage terminase large subunit
MDNPDRIVGYEVAYSLIDETDILPIHKMEEVYGRILGRNRCRLPDGEPNRTDVVGTPEGFKWFYKYFVKESNENRKLIRAKTKDNKFLPNDYIDTLKDTYTDEQLAAYLNGEFINLTSGTVYNSFDRILNHSPERENEADVLHIGMDFNVTNMHAVVHIVRNNKPIAVGELVGLYDTKDMCRAIHERYKQKVVIYPDASGKSRKSSGGSDFRIIQQFGFKIIAPDKNPFVKDRVNSMNINFCDNDGNRNYLVNTDQCPTYTESLEQLSYKNGEPDKTSGFDHITEAAGYYIYNRFGLKRKRRGVKA